MAARPPTSAKNTPDEAPENETAILALLATVVFMAVVNGTMVNVALPYVGEDFRCLGGDLRLARHGLLT